VPEFVVGPRIRQRPADSWSTVIGGFGQPELGRVDAGGLVSPSGSNWTVDWWVRVGKSWVVPAVEPAVRQGRIGSGPVVETALRVPGGDIRQRVYGVVLGGRPAIGVEIHNDLDEPVAVGIGLRPYDRFGERTGIHQQVSIEEGLVRVGDALALVLPRPPSESGVDDTQDLLGCLQQDQSMGWQQGSNPSDRNAAVILPVVHKSVIRFLIPVGDNDETDHLAKADPRSAPDSDMVARGWDSIVNSGSQFNFPDPAVTSLFGAARARLLVASPKLDNWLTTVQAGAGGLLGGLSMGGYQSEVAAALVGFADRAPTRFGGDPEAAADIVEGLARAVSMGGVGDDVLSSVVELAIRWTRQIDKSGEGSDRDKALNGLARLAYQAGDRLGAKELVSQRQDSQNESANFEVLSDLMAQASPTGVWGDDDLAQATRFVTIGRNMVVDDSGLGDKLALLPYFPTGWRGGNAEYVGVGVLAAGTVSYAIRWHGARPALLWELAGTATQSIVSCPSLDIDWTADAAKGETLLAGASDSLPAPAQPGESFI